MTHKIEKHEIYCFTCTNFDASRGLILFHLLLRPLAFNISFQVTLIILKKCTLLLKTQVVKAIKNNFRSFHHENRRTSDMSLYQYANTL